MSCESIVSCPFRCWSAQEFHHDDTRVMKRFCHRQSCVRFPGSSFHTGDNDVQSDWCSTFNFIIRCKRGKKHPLKWIVPLIFHHADRTHVGVRHSTLFVWFEANFFWWCVAHFRRLIFTSSITLDRISSDGKEKDLLLSHLQLAQCWWASKVRWTKSHRIHL